MKKVGKNEKKWMRDVWRLSEGFVEEGEESNHSLVPRGLFSLWCQKIVNVLVISSRQVNYPYCRATDGN